MDGNSGSPCCYRECSLQRYVVCLVELEDKTPGDHRLPKFSEVPMRSVVRRSIVMMTLIATPVPGLWAQSERVRLSGGLSDAVGDGGPALAISVAGGFQLAPRAGLEVELLTISGQEFGRTTGPVPLVFSSALPTSRVVTGRSIAFLSSFVADLEIGRMRPYAQFGGGIANVRRRFTVGGGGEAVSTLQGLQTTVQQTSTEASANDLALAAGAGLDVRVWKRLSIAADVRYLRVFDNQRGLDELDITRIGTRLAYSF